MPKLYLIRKGLESFVGPMTLAEMKEAHKRMGFGLQDEVSGHCGPWVIFEDLERIKKYYPEVARIVNEDMLAGWGVSNHGVPLKEAAPEETRRLQAKPSRSFGFAVAFLVIAVLAFAAAVYMANNGRFSGKLKDGGEEPVLEQAQGFLDRRDSIGFDQYMEANLEGIVRKTVLAKNGESPWLPHLRLFAFSHEGAVKDLDPKLLRGATAASAPSDCSLRTWRKRWRASVKQWAQQANERKLVRGAHWSRLLAWDPHWIRRRDSKGWPTGLNYYVMCLSMADKALAEVAADPSLVTTAADWDKLGMPKLRQRLTWVLEMAKDGQSTQSFQADASNPMSSWNCFEGARDLKSLARCREGASEPSDPWTSYNDERYAWNVVRLAAKEKGVPTPELLDLVAKVTAKINKADYFTRFDYRPEHKFARGLGKSSPVEKSVEKVQGEFTDVKFVP